MVEVVSEGLSVVYCTQLQRSRLKKSQFASVRKQVDDLLRNCSKPLIFEESHGKLTIDVMSDIGLQKSNGLSFFWQEKIGN